MKIQDLSVIQYPDISLEGNGKKPTVMSYEEWQKINQKAANTIRHALVVDILHSVLEEDSTMQLWPKLESLYMTKSLTNQLFVKQ